MMISHGSVSCGLPARSENVRLLRSHIEGTAEELVARGRLDKRLA
jgi:hypothetical protein